MDYLKLGLGLVQLLSTFVRWMKDRQLLKAGEDALIAAEMRAHADQIHTAQVVRDGVAADLAADPSKLRADDGFKRPD